MLLRSPARVAASGLVAFALQLAPSIARAESLVVSTDGVSLDGDRYYTEVTIQSGHKLGVNPYTASKPASGKLHLFANKIVIESGASIVASAAGYPGADKADGTGPGGGKVGPTGQPGGGGAHLGIGGEGTEAATCTAVTTMLGGTAYGDAMTFDLGSAGGAAGVDSPGTSGGRGGGVVILEAAEITIDGAVEANGADGTAFVGMVGSGGGAGGTIVLIAAQLTLGPTASISAKGGNGGPTTSNGGGGGGGLVVIQAPTDPGATPDVSAGASGTCAAVKGGPGSAQVVALPGTCIDVDEDGHEAIACGGDDCDDAAATVAPGFSETCDGVDNDCDGAVDDALADDACVAPATCVSGQCVAPTDGGTDGGAGSAPTKPDHLAYEGGCALGQVPPRAGLGVLGAALAALVALRRKRRAR
jgi:hypothetical protein